MVSRRIKRVFKDNWELITYTVTSDSGTFDMEDFTSAGLDYLSIGEVVDMEVQVRVFHDKDGQMRWSLRRHNLKGQF